ncbi:hypothetical protein [Aliiroseovarius crassostreae]|uniref:hypothetical protein n=1 Tax=Aliiroseovarius crassostreae TaxID=154981 RepID=UPI003C7BD59F
MTKRFELTPEFVDTQAPPETGELWFSDSIVPGLGLRLRAGKKGGTASYCLRAKDQNGNWTRRQFNTLEVFLDVHNDGDPTPFFSRSLGSFLPHARKWAKRQKKTLSGDISTPEARRDHWLEKRELAKRTHFGDHLDAFFAAVHQDAKQKSSPINAQRNLDQLEQLCWRTIPQTLRDRPFGSLSTVELVSSLTINGRDITQFQAILGTITQLQRKLGIQGANRDLTADELYPAFRELREEQIKDWYDGTGDRYRAIRKEVYDQLNSAPLGHIPSACVALYLTTGAKLRPTLSARWDQFKGQSWYPYPKGSRASWFWAEERIDPEMQEFLGAYRTQLEKQFSDSPYLFPSRMNASGHITSVQRYWRKIVRVTSWDEDTHGPASLYLFASSVKARHSPSYIRKPGTMLFHAIENSKRQFEI